MVNKQVAGRWKTRVRIGLVVVVGAFVLLLAALYTTFTAMSRHGVKTDVAMWEERLGTPEELYARYPHREVNPSALKVETLSAELGVDLATKIMSERTHPRADAADDFESIGDDIHQYTWQEWARSGAGSAPPPEALAAFLTAHAEALEALRQALREGEAPRWELQLEKGLEGPIPNLLGQIKLQRLLMSEALAQNHAGHTGKALETLEAAGRLNEALADDPILITQLIAVAAHRMQAMTLRRLEEIPGVWAQTLAEHDYEETMRTAISLEAWNLAHLDPAQVAEGLPWWQRLLARVGAPYIRSCAYDTSRRWMRRLDAQAANPGPCRMAGDLSDRNEEWPTSWWNVYGQFFGNPLHLAFSAFGRVSRMEVEDELTGQWIELTNARRTAGGEWPGAWPRSVPSQACPQGHWTYEISPDGEASIAFSESLEWPQFQGAKSSGRRSSAIEGV